MVDKAKADIIQLSEADLKTLGHWIRNKSGLEVFDGACYERRVEFFMGDEIMDCLMSQTLAKKQLCKDIPKKGLSRDQAFSIADQMMQLGFYHRAYSTNLETKDDDEMHILAARNHAHFDDGFEDFYIWTLPQSNTRVILQSVAFVTGAVFLAAIKAWPIWLKIMVWWISLIMLICLSSLIVIRLVLYAIFMLFGFRGIWLLPNMFNDDLDFLDAFQPLFGTGMSAKAARDKVQRELKKERAKQYNSKKGKNSAKKQQTPDKPVEETVEAKPEEEEEDEVQRCYGYNIGLINVAIFLIIAIVICNYMGLFMPDNIPEFVVAKNDLFKQFPSLAPPNETLANETVVEAECGPDNCDACSEQATCIDEPGCVWTDGPRGTDGWCSLEVDEEEPLEEAEGEQFEEHRQRGELEEEEDEALLED